MKLKTGEWIDGLEYGWMKPLFAPKEHTLTVSFLQDVDDAWRQQSRQELVTRHLIPSAFVHDYGVAVLLEKSSHAAIGPLQASLSQDWTFQHVEGWQWKQTDGPDIDWSIVEQEYVEFSDKLDVPSKFLVTTYPDGKYNLILNAVAKPDVGPEAAMLALVDLVDQQLQCSQSERNLPEIYSDPLLNGIYFYVYPEKQVNKLTVMPRVHTTLGRTDGELVCSRKLMLDQLDGIDWTHKSEWRDIWISAILGRQ